MNIFIIPSWYPDSKHLTDGIFIKEQVEALAEFHPGINFTVSVCGNNYMSFSKPGKALRSLGSFISSEKKEIHLKNNLTELHCPALTWSAKLGGEVNNIIKAHAFNLKRAEEKFGNVDLIHAHVSFPGGYSAMSLKKETGIPYVITEHMCPFPFEMYLNKNKISDKISDPLNNADRIITVSSALSKDVRSFGINAPVVIPNLVNEEFFIPSEREFSGSKVKFLTLCSFSDRKGIKELLEGILIAAENSVNFEITISGTGYPENYIENFIKENSLKGKVQFVKDPDRRRLPEMFRQNDAFILPSRLESFGIVYIEAMSCGIPVIATDCGGPADFVKDFNGVLIPVGDPGKIAEALKYVSENISGYSKQKIRNFVIENYSRRAVTDKIVTLYKEVLKIY
ncbi:MAG: glycosyltransferase [Bacteroidetes bacterium]|nr:glycosyltransferase [Bacteroidota bacterium]